MKPGSIPVCNRIGLALGITLSLAGSGFAQALVSESFEKCPTGRLDCQGWAGPAEVIEARGDRILALTQTDAPSEVRFKPASTVVLSEGSTYVVSASVRTDSLSHPLVIGSRLIDSTGSALSNAVRVVGSAATSSWYRLQLVLAPTQNARFDLSFEIEGADSPRGRVLIDDVEVSLADLATPPPGLANVCPEGYFANLAHSENDCLPLDVTINDLTARVIDTLVQSLHIDVDRITDGEEFAALGYDDHRFWSGFRSVASNETLVDECTRAALQSAVDSIALLGGGRIRLLDCTFSIDNPITISGSSNVILEGAGIGRTLLERTSGRGPLLEIEGSENVIIRDLDFRMNGVYLSKLSIWKSTNVLVERIAIVNPGSAAILSRNSSRITVRYSFFDSGPKWLGDSGCQDGWFKGPPPEKGDLDGDGKGSIYECEQRWFADYAPGSRWSASYAAYSNIAVDNSFAMHAVLGEIAGNRFVRSTANKLADGQFWWIHHNEFAGARADRPRTPALWTTSDGIIDRRSRNNLIYRNRFSNLTTSPVRTHGGINYVFENEFTSVEAAPKFGRQTVICEGTPEFEWLRSGDRAVGKPTVAPEGFDAFCSLDRAGTFWAYPNVSFRPPNETE